MSEWRRPALAPPTSGILIRLVAISGMLTSCLSRCVTHAKAARGTIVAMVGMRASCQPMPVLMMVAPAASIACASCDDLVERAAAFDQIEHRQAIDHDEVLARPLRACDDDLDRKPHPVLDTIRPIRRRDDWCAARRTG